METFKVADSLDVEKALALLAAVRKINRYETSGHDGDNVVIRFENVLGELNDLPYDNGSVLLEDILIQGATMLDFPDSK